MRLDSSQRTLQRPEDTVFYVEEDRPVPRV
jgi:hypothetical protein